MTRSALTIRIVLASILLSLAPMSALAQSLSTQFQLVPADTLSQDNQLILTVPLENTSLLPAVSAAIQNRYGVTLSAEWPLRSISVHCLVIDTNGSPDIDGLIARMRADPQIRTVQRLQVFDTLQGAYSDPLLPAQTALIQLNAIAAQRISMGDGVTVGIIDSRINRSHPDLAHRVLDARDFVGSPQTSHGEAHGTAMAGIIASNANNELGIAGIAPEADLVDLRACWQKNASSGHCNSFSLARALNYAILNNIRVINMSLGGPADPLLEELIRTAVDGGFIIVAARGEGPELTFPASLPGVLAAGSSNANDSIPAPSVDVLTTSADGDYHYVSGSSVAAANVSGVIALMVSKTPDLTNTVIENALRASVIPQGRGRMLDACKALQTVSMTSIDCSAHAIRPSTSHNN